MTDQNIPVEEPIIPPSSKVFLNKKNIVLYFLCFIIVILAGGIIYLLKSRNTNISSPTYPEPIPSDKASLTSVPTPSVIASSSSVSISSTRIPTIKNANTTSAPKSASLTLKLTTKDSREPISNFVGRIINSETGRELTRFSGDGYQKVITDIPDGNYYMNIMIGDDLNQYGCAYSRSIDFSIKNGQSLNQDVEILPYKGVIYLKTDDNYPLSNSTVSVINEAGDKVYYSTTSDNFGRAVINSVNANPHWLKITSFGQTEVRKIDNGKCIWSEIIKLPISVNRSTLNINISSNVKWPVPQLIKIYEPLTINDGVPGLNSDALGKYSFTEALCSGGFAMSFGTNLTQLKDNSGNYSSVFQINNILPGKYYVCAYDPSKGLGMSYKSDWKEVELNPGATSEININYPGN